MNNEKEILDKLVLQLKELSQDNSIPMIMADEELTTLMYRKEVEDGRYKHGAGTSRKLIDTVDYQIIIR